MLTLPRPVDVGGALSWPVAGKHLAFDGRLLHGTVHELAADGRARRDESENAGRPQDVLCEPYVRVTLLVNLWAGHRPREARRLPSDLAAQLSSRSAVTRAVPSFLPRRPRIDLSSPRTRRGLGVAMAGEPSASGAARAQRQRGRRRRLPYAHDGGGLHCTPQAQQQMAQCGVTSRGPSPSSTLPSASSVCHS